MKRNKKKILLFLLGCICGIAMSMGMTNETVEAKVKWELQKIDHSKTYQGSACTIDVQNYYEYVQLKGKSKAIQAINKKLRADAVKTMKNESMAKENAAEDCDNEYRTMDDVYYDCTSQTVTYQSKGLICVLASYNWYSGGVNNNGISGYVFDLKTGKQVKNITKLTKEKSLSKIKKTLVKKALASDEYLTESEVSNAIMGKKATEFDFYLDKKGKVIVCFGPYELGYGGWGREFSLSGK